MESERFHNPFIGLDTANPSVVCAYKQTHSVEVGKYILHLEWYNYRETNTYMASTFALFSFHLLHGVMFYVMERLPTKIQRYQIGINFGYFKIPMSFKYLSFWNIQNAIWQYEIDYWLKLLFSNHNDT